MRRSANFPTVLMLSAAATFVLATLSSAQAGGNCESKLAGHSYECTSADHELGMGSGCITVETGKVSAYFDFVFAGGADYGCVCDTTGSVASPSYDASSSSFECEESSGIYQITGKISGKNISAQASDAEGDSVIISCKETPSCS